MKRKPHEPKALATARQKGRPRMISGWLTPAGKNVPEEAKNELLATEDLTWFVVQILFKA
jgi:hypothetical protein